MHALHGRNSSDIPAHDAGTDDMNTCDTAVTAGIFADNILQAKQPPQSIGSRCHHQHRENISLSG